ncbi:MAG: DUF3025 domain-containing protein [Sideroxydans sp.]|nr:DUF3025 domain-containing protein [Sideroxydans sp.]
MISLNPNWDKSALQVSLAFAPLHSVIEQLDAHHFPTLHDFNKLLNAQSTRIKVASGLPLRFVEQVYGQLLFEEQYEPRCYLKGEVPTRANNWHDLFNALVWLTFSHSKAAINARHYQALTQIDGASKVSGRGAVRDAITLLDESGVIVPYADETLADLLRGFQWKELFWNQRTQVELHMDFYLYGHGLYEKSLKPYVGMTGQGLLLKVEPSFFTQPLAQRLVHLDKLLANYLNDFQHCTDTQELSPVPLLGIPGWTEDNKASTYYDNADYFRRGRRNGKRNIQKS